MIKQLNVGVIGAALLVSTAAFAAKPGYLTDKENGSVVRSSAEYAHECVRTGYFDKNADGLVECGDRVAAKAAEPKKVEPAPVKMVEHKEKITLSAEVLFDFDKAVLRSDAKRVLDPIFEKLKDKSGDFVRSVEVVGHTDFIGTDRYNLTLSQKRADAVKAYLVRQGIPASKIDSVGKGKADAKMSEVCGSKFKLSTHRKALIACLAPDRRVDLNIDALKDSME